MKDNNFTVPRYGLSIELIDNKTKDTLVLDDGFMTDDIQYVINQLEKAIIKLKKHE